MYRHTVLHRVVLSAAAAATVIVVSGCGTQKTAAGAQSGDMGAMPGMSQSAPASEASFNDTDVAFAQMMIPDHQMTAKMAKLAEKKAASKDLKNLAAQMRQDQSQAVAKLRDWLTAWGKPASSDMAAMPGAMSDKDMDMLASMTGMQFDMMFAQMMIKHHEGSMRMARDEQAKGASADAKAIAAKMLKKQRAEVEQLRRIADM